LCSFRRNDEKILLLKFSNKWQDNIKWIKGAQENKLVVGSQARILYADAEGRIKIAEAFNKAIARKKLVR
jgi:urocanate hydratase